MPAHPRKSPCATCPYRRSVPSGVWASEEYDKLRRYDLPMPEQPVAVFSCHQGAGEVCSGWLGHGDPNDLLAVRFGIIDGRLDPSCAEYQTAVPLFSSGAEAAEHGEHDEENPAPEAVNAIRKIIRVRAASAEGPIVIDS